MFVCSTPEIDTNVVIMMTVGSHSKYSMTVHNISDSYARGGGEGRRE